MTKTPWYFDELINIHQNAQLSLSEKMIKMRTCLEQVCKELTKDDGLAFSNLFGRLNYLCNRQLLSPQYKSNLHQFRKKVNQILHRHDKASIEEYNRSLKVLCESFVFFYQIAAPLELQELVDKLTLSPLAKKKLRFSASDIRAVVERVDRQNKRLLVKTEKEEQEFWVEYGVEGVNEELTASAEQLEVNDLICLLHVLERDDSVLIPEYIVYQPDYLLDVTSIAKCFQRFQNKYVWAFELYFSSRAEQQSLSAAMLKGNVVNLFFDELINNPDDSPLNYDDLLWQSFKDYPLLYTALDHIDQKYFDELKTQYENLKRTIAEDFSKGDYQPIDRVESALEVFFISPELGIQGRMDLFDETPAANAHYQSKIIELKSGKLPFPASNPNGINEEHAAQVRMYNMLVNNVLKHDPRKIFNAILYSSSPNAGEAVRYVPYLKQHQRAIINVRNQIVQWEFKLASDKAPYLISRKLAEQIDEPIRKLDQSNPNMEWFFRRFTSYKQLLLREISLLEQKYYFAFSSFITREKIMAKIGDGERSKGLSALWNKEDLSELDAFNQLRNLVIVNNQADKPEALITLKRTEKKQNFSNFRRGDIGVFYPEVANKPLATEHRIVKCFIVSISKEEVCIRLRQRQSSLKMFDAHPYWSIEHDVLDNNFEQMQHALFDFLRLKPAKKELLLGLQAPRQTNEKQLEFISPNNQNYTAESIAQQNEVLSKAVNAKDYFLLAGPPGTGKTQLFLHRLVKHLIEHSSLNILLVSFTNRAVDEMCSSVRGIVDDQMIRIGSQLGCAPEQETLLLDNKIGSLQRRSEIKALIKSTRLYVGTLASVNGKAELFKLKSFDLIIVDEASQILEPSIIALLGKAKRFILIGDERQLPAVVTQGASDSQVSDKDLQGIGLNNTRNSYFERLLNLCKKNNWHGAWGELTHQGRMHPEIADFPNQHFYQNKLRSAQLAHQTAQLGGGSAATNKLDAFLLRHRLIFIPSEVDLTHLSDKSNAHEAQIISKIVQRLCAIHRLNDAKDVAEKIGIITPYRNQIACIGEQLEQDKVPHFDRIQIDTVERYQGGQKDFIILSMCVNKATQLHFITANRTVLAEDPKLLIDRKLNVSLTRAKQQIILVGNEALLRNDTLYNQLMETYCKIEI